MTTPTAQRVSVPTKASAVAAADGADTGEVSALVSVFDVIDWGGDVVRPGAFAAAVADVKAGNVIPVIWSHQTGDPHAFVGEVDDLDETPEGLVARMKFDLGDPTAAKVFRLVKGGRVKGWSFGYDVVDAGTEIVDGEPATALRSVRLFEVGPTMYPMNDSTRTLEAKAGRVLSSVNIDRLTRAADLIAEVIAAATEAAPMAPSDGPPAAGMAADETPPGKSAAAPEAGPADESLLLALRRLTIEV